MFRSVSLWMVLVLGLGLPLAAEGKTKISLASEPCLSPDGKRLVFSHRGDLWEASSGGGLARRLTSHPARERTPRFSPSGEQLAFVSDRSGEPQVYVMPAGGGLPQQTTFHTEGAQLIDWDPAGESLIILGARDHHWKHAERLFRVDLTRRRAEQLLVDAAVEDAAIAPNGRELLIVREGSPWWRQGYRGSQAAQLWRFDLKARRFEALARESTDARWPMWGPDGKFYLYVGDVEGTPNLCRRRVDQDQVEPLTHYRDDGVAWPAISRDGKTVVFRRLFDLYRFRPDKDKQPKKIELFENVDDGDQGRIRRRLTTASNVSFTEDALEIAVIAGDDLWVMDTVLKEPRRITATVMPEEEPVFDPQAKAIYYIANDQGQCDLYQVERKEPKKYWWQNESFETTRLTNDAESESNINLSPDGKTLAYVRGSGDLYLMDLATREPRRLISGFDAPDYGFSPDGKWIAYSASDDNFNRDIWIVPVNGSRPPFNVSRHPDDDSNPAWSPDGKILAFTGRRVEDEVDIYYVYLAKAAHDQDSRTRRYDDAIQKMQKGRKPAEEEKSEDKEKKPDAKPQEKQDGVQIDFDGLPERVRRVSIPQATESNLFWSPDGQKLAFSATINGKSGTYTVSPPEKLSPQLLSGSTIGLPKWNKKTNSILGLSGNLPAAISGSNGSRTQYKFSVFQELERAKWHQAIFELCWRVMRDRWYDARHNNRNWDAIRRKYQPAAAAATDLRAVATVVQLMLGELNGSHLGFYPTLKNYAPEGWRPITVHLGVRFDPQHKGPGLKVRDVLPGGPAEKAQSRLEPGDIILAIDDQPVDPDLDLTTLLSGLIARDVKLTIRAQGGAQDEAESAEAKSEPDPVEKDLAQKAETDKDAEKSDESQPNEESKGKPEADDDKAESEPAEREVRLRPITYSAARGLLYKKWVEDNRQRVESLSDGQLGYVHIAAMSTSSFIEFERQLYAAGFDKQGLVIDVRENGGGFTADHLLTCLTQPRHAFTIPRGGGAGYPQDRKVYATWSKPIVVLCNQNSFSNAEIFSHAIKTLKRGKLVGVPTAGGVISTGATRILGVGLLRVPFRGWFLRDSGEDMERNGARPDIVIWPRPGEIPRGKDRQLDKAVAVLNKEVQQAADRAAVQPKYASER